MRVEREESRQMIYVDDNDRAHHAYVVTFFPDSANGGSPTRPVVIIDARSGRLLRQSDNLQTAHTRTGPGGTKQHAPSHRTRHSGQPKARPETEQVGQRA